jgi:hypothetical protein
MHYIKAWVNTQIMAKPLTKPWMRIAGQMEPLRW